ncbi:PqqD family peptide modification chaperone, partial [Acidimicrobiaceae bacterium USS-CC1]|nr:PqqD family peptide modification chaperone [Acidiferrimicrobium australe]
GLVVLPPDRAACLAVSGATGLLWELLAEPVDADELVERMAAETGADRAAIRAQVEVGLQVLAEAGVLCRAARAGA